MSVVSPIQWYEPYHRVDEGSRVRGGRMRAVAAITAVLALLAVGGIVLILPGDDGSAPVRASAGEEKEGLGPAEPDDYFLFQRASGGDLPGRGEFTRAVRQAQDVLGRTAAAHPNAPAWTLEGPTNIGGRLADLAVDPSREDTL